MGLAQLQPACAAEEYLALERQAEERHQFVDGQIYAMAGETPAHSTVCVNITVVLGSQLRGKPCRIYSPNMKIRSSPAEHKPLKGMFSYADLSVVCGEPRFHDQHRDVLLNPRLIVEVLSPSTEAFDRGEKFLRYRSHLESLTDYLLVSTRLPFVEHFQRQSDGLWLYSAAVGLEGSLLIASLDCRLPLAEVYERVEFAGEEEQAGDAG
jgi:Uma2 family endonuclease